MFTYIYRCTHVRMGDDRSLLPAFRRWHRDSKRLPGGSGRAAECVQMDLTIPQKLAILATIPRFTRMRGSRAFDGVALPCDFRSLLECQFLDFTAMSTPIRVLPSRTRSYKSRKAPLLRTGLRFAADFSRTGVSAPHDSSSWLAAVGIPP